MRHYSKVIVEMPDGPDDPPFAVVSIDCDVCGEDEHRIHVAHLGTFLRVLTQTVEAVNDGGISQSFSPLIASTPANRRKVKKYLDREFPGWKTERIRRT